MKRDLSIDAQQVYIGDSSTLTLGLSKENKTDTLLSVFSPREETDSNNNKITKNQSLYLILDNLSEDRSARIEFACNSTGNDLTLTANPNDPTEKNKLSDKKVRDPILNDLFRRITPLTTLVNLPTGKQTISISWQIEVWDKAGSYTIEAFVADSGQLADDPRDIGNSAIIYDQVRKNYGTRTDFGILKLKVVEDSAEVVNVSLREAKREDTPDQLLWILIRNRTIDFNRYRGFIDKVMCSQEIGDQVDEAHAYGKGRMLPFNRAASYSMLKAATEFYLMQEAGLVPPAYLNDLLGIPQNPVTNSNGSIVPKTLRSLDTQFGLGASQESRRTGRSNISGINIPRLRDEYLEQLEGEGGRALPYFKIIRQKLSELPLKNIVELPDMAYDACYGILQSKLLNPPLLELIWSYWQEEGGLVQTLNAISLRFQNVRRGLDRDPLANLAIDPLRPLGNLIWGYIEDERNRLTLNRRNLEYQYEYGISLIGKAVQNIPVAEHRTNFLRGFHELLRAATEFYQQANFTTVIPDGFPMLNHLREVHLMLAEGAHNQYGDLPWAARVEMLTQQWILARPEVREFLGGRIMVPYTEPWMDRVDNMKQLQGWNPTNITHFRDLGVFGEQLLLSIRYGSWNDPTLGGSNAANWAQYWRAEIQRYIHAYKAVTGVDLASDIVDTRIMLPANEDRYQQPAQLIERQAAMRQNGQVRPRQVNGPSASGQLPSNGQILANGQLIRKEFNG